MHAFRVTRDGGAGLSYSGTRRSTFRSPTSGVRLPSVANTWLDDVRAIALVLPPSAAFSHHTAAQLLQLPLPASNTRPLHVTVARRGQRGRRKAVRWHLGDVEPVAVSGLPVTDLGRTWLDLGPHLNLQELVAVADVVLRRGEKLQVPRGVRAAQRLRQSLALADPRSRSPQESMLRVQMHQAGLPAPALNQDIIHEGEWIGCGDFVWERYGLYLEYDGAHHEDPEQRHQDAQTRNRLGQLGWRVRVLTSRMMDHPNEVVAMIAEELRARGWHG